MIGKPSLSQFGVTAANWTSAILAIVLTAAVAKTMLVGSAADRSRPDQVKVGDKISLPGVKLGPGNTVVLALREGCPYCARSAPLYKEIIQAAQLYNRGVVAVLPGSVESGKGYLATLGIVQLGTYQMDLSILRVRGTPTLLLVTEGGIVERVWYGLQPPEKTVGILKTIYGPEYRRNGSVSARQ
jgi:hypothetical protein